MKNTITPVQDQADGLRMRGNSTQPQNQSTAVYSITSGKGGVGKTALVANLAYQLAAVGKKVLILDADLGLANVDIVFGLTPKYNMNHFFSGEQPLSKVMIEGPLGIQILPAGSGVQNFIYLDGRQKMMLLDGLDSLHNHFDYVLIDTEAGISENVTYFNTAAQEILIVTTPDPTALTDAYAVMKLLFTKYHEKKFNLIVNQIHSEDEALDVYRKLTMVANRYLNISIDYIGSVPSDKQMNEAIRKQKVISELYPSSKISTAFQQIAQRVCLEPVQSKPKGSLQFFWKKLLHEKE